MHKLDPHFAGALDDAILWAATYKDAGLIMWICDRAAPPNEVPARTYAGNVGAVHAIDAIVGTFSEHAQEPHIRRCLDEITAAIRRAGGTMDMTGAEPISARRTN